MTFNVHHARLAVEKLASDGLHLQRQLMRYMDKLLVSGQRCLSADDRGYALDKVRSTVHGEGIVVSAGCIAAAGELVCLYPGTVYDPMSDPLFLASFRNSFVLRRIDGLVVDGKDCGISARIFKSCALRDRSMYGRDRCDWSWLYGQCGSNHLACGHYINYSNQPEGANVSYLECDIRKSDLAPEQLALLPFVQYSLDHSDTYARITGLVSLRKIEEGEELFSSYFAVNSAS